MMCGLDLDDYMKYMEVRGQGMVKKGNVKLRLV